jgi:SAM-dependent methyltransferase
MGRYSSPLAPLFADFGRVSDGQTVLDVGCGPGALTGELVGRVGASAVTAVDPSESFVAAVEERHPGVTVRLAPAEELPFEDAIFDTALAQLVVHFMRDPVAGLGEMARVTRVRELDPSAQDESLLAGAREGHLTDLFERSGLREVEETALTVSVEHPTFEEWWEPYALGVGPAGAYVVGLDPEAQEKLRERCRARLPEPPFVIEARAWSARGRV